MEVMYLVFLLIGLFVGFLVAWFYVKSAQKANPLNDALKSENNLQLIEITRLTERLAGIQNEYQKLKSDFDLKIDELTKANTRLAKAEEAFRNQEDKIAEQKRELEELQQKFTKEFENIANRIFEEKNKQNKTNLDDILKPLGEKIKDFEKKVNDVYVNESKERASLKQQLETLHLLNQQMSKEAQNLTKALKGETKTQGNWGEIILESVLEKSGLVKGREYQMQVSLTADDGKRYQPDVVVNLPDGKHLVIDSKVSLNAYERYSSAETEDEKIMALKEHVFSVRKHIKELSEKKYQSLYQLQTLDFVLLFIPVEPAFALSIQSDMQLFNEAFEKNIVIVSPSTMLATLRTVASIWRQENQNKNAIEIARQGGALYDKFVSFVEDLEEIGSRLNKTSEAYSSSMNKLKNGTGNLIKRTEELKKLGAKASKQINPLYIEKSENEDK